MVEELGKDAHHRLFQIEDGVEIEELHQQVALVLLLEHRQLLDAALGLVFLLGDVRIDTLIVDDGASVQGRGKHQSFERTAAAQGDIHLTWSKRLISVNDGAVEGQALTLVNGDGPRQSEG